MTQNAPLLPERLIAPAPAAGAPVQQPLPLASPGVQCIVWDSRWGRMLIEIEGDRMRVNGRLVEPAEVQLRAWHGPSQGLAP